MKFPPTCKKCKLHCEGMKLTFAIETYLCLKFWLRHSQKRIKKNCYENIRT